MANEIQGRGTIALLGAAAAAVVAVLLGVLYWERAQPPAPSQNSPRADAQTSQGSGSQPQAPAPTMPQGAAASKPASSGEATKPSPDAPIAPTFDVVRIEPDGESVIAGRAAPGATIELLRGDQVHARAAADASGLFAIVPPPLPPGSHQIVLQSIAPDGTRQRSRESVTVVLDTAKTRPLVALTTPDKPTVLLSNPQPPEPKPAQETAPSQETKGAETPAQAKPQQQASATPETAPQQNPGSDNSSQPTSRPEIKIVTVESEEGKLFVSGQTAPGATVRLYLNESFVAPGGAGGDGKVSFSIASGVKPGDYRVRLDDVDPVSGQVKSRAEVGYNVPAQVAAAQKTGPVIAPEKTPAAGLPLGGNQTASASPDVQEVPSGTVVVPNITTAIVSRGDNLWRISQRTYGQGYRYTVIYGANQEQIRNPNLIYPGQVFVLPNGQAEKTN
jgi:nucleoid-associated protein YgaU